ncbi:MAG: DUF4476 domain-containing protein [Bacteroidales bacterium]|nr:DUF4476 domain-containing protein [Bacteroidales bacterium]
MRKILILTFLIALCFAISSLQAQHPGAMTQASLTVSSDHHAFWLFIDDYQLNDKSTTSIRVDRIPEGEHYVRVEIDNQQHNTVGQYIMLNDRNNQYRIEKQGHLYGLSLSYGMIRPAVVAIYPTKPQNSLHPQGHHNPGNTFHPRAPMPMNNADFQAAMTYIQSKNFDKDKMSAAKQVLLKNFMTVNQIEQVCRLFSFDKDKLEFAKYAYSRCVDQNRYFMLNSVFTFESSKTELDKFVQQQH